MILTSNKVFCLTLNFSFWIFKPYSGGRGHFSPPILKFLPLNLNMLFVLNIVTTLYDLNAINMQLVLNLFFGP